MQAKEESKKEKDIISKIKINADCPCYEISCARHGKCELCQKYHHALKQQTCCGK